MAEKYRSNGSAVYDIYWNRESTARPLERPARLPEEPHPKPAGKARRRSAISPITVLSAATALCMLFLVVFSYMRMFEAKSELSELEQTREELTQENERLQSEYENSLDMEQIEQRARALGMQQALPSQLHTIDIPEGDTTEVYAEEEEGNLFERAFESYRSVISDAAEYFS